MKLQHTIESIIENNPLLIFLLAAVLISIVLLALISKYDFVEFSLKDIIKLRLHTKERSDSGATKKNSHPKRNG